MLKNLFFFINILAAIGLVITYITPFIDPLSFKKLPIIGLFYPLLLLINIAFLGVWLFTSKTRYAILSLIIILIGIRHVSAILSLTFNKENTIENKNLVKIGTYNIKSLEEIAWKNKTFQPGAVKDIQQQFKDLDFLCLQETNYRADQLFKKQFPFPFSQQFKGVRIFSKLPLLQKGNIPFDSKSNACIWADIKIDETIIRVYSLHLESNHITSASEQITQRNGIGWKSRIIMLKDMFREYAYRGRLRVEQTQLVLDHIQKSPHPVIVCGDFNDSPLSYIYRQFSDILQDGFTEKGSGFSFSYRGTIPFLRIDYIFSSPILQFQDYQTIRSMPYSDHYPVIASINIEQ